MRRREFLGLIGGAVAIPVSAWAQTSEGKARVGTLGFSAMLPSVVKAFTEGIGQSASNEPIIEHRDAHGRPELLPELATELVRGNVAVIFARGPDALIAARNATNTIPIVAVDFESDPIARGFATTLSKPGANITGLFLDVPELTGKQIELLKEILPGLTRVAIIGDPAINATQFWAAAKAAQVFGIEPENVDIRVPQDFDGALENAKSKKADAGVLLSSPLVFNHMKDAAAAITAKRLPVISLFGEFPIAGGLMSYGPDVPEAFRRCGAYVGRILNGAKAGDLPIERPTKFELVINARTAATFGITMPALLLAQADKVIE